MLFNISEYILQQLSCMFKTTIAILYPVQSTDNNAQSTAGAPLQHYAWFLLNIDSEKRLLAIKYRFEWPEIYLLISEA